jgi:hypothetical protein
MRIIQSRILIRINLRDLRESFETFVVKFKNLTTKDPKFNTKETQRDLPN